MFKGTDVRNPQQLKIVGITAISYFFYLEDKIIQKIAQFEI